MKKIIVFDTTLRDGQQSPGANLDIYKKVQIAKLLDKLNVDIIEAGFPVSSVKEFVSIKKISKILNNAKICTLARHKIKDVDLCLESMIHSKNKRLHLFISTSPLHMKYKLNLKPDDIIENIEYILKYSRKKIDDIEWSCEDGTRSDPKFIVKCFEVAIKHGARTLNIADTVGYSSPTEIINLIKYIKIETRGIEKCKLSIHCHNDLGLATANTLAAVTSGVDQIECTINGIGERAGNAALEEVVMSLKTRSDFYKCKTNINTRMLMKTSNLVSKFTNIPLSKIKPILGKNVFSHESGIHQHGVIQNRQTYEIMDPVDIGREKSEIVLGSHSGLRGIKYKLDYYKLNYKEINLYRFVNFFKKKTEKLKVVDKGLFLNLFREFKNMKNIL